MRIWYKIKPIYVIACLIGITITVSFWKHLISSHVVELFDKPPVIRDVHSCVAALKMSEFYDAAEDSMKYPPITSDTVTVPFFVFPELMPKPPATLYSCHTPSGNVKKSEWSPHAIRAIESHEWRVHSPDEALLFVIPLFDFIKSGGEECSSGVSYRDENAFERIKQVLDYYIEYVNPKNVVLLEGAYFSARIRAAHLAESLVELEKTNRVMTETEKVWFNIQTYVFTQVGCAIKRFQGIRPMSINVDNTMFSPHADEDIRKIGDSLKEKIEKEMKLGYSGWSKRLLNIQSFGRFDNRLAYVNRKYIVRDMEQLQIEGSLPSSFDPSLILYKIFRAADLAIPRTWEDKEVFGNLKNGDSFIRNNAYPFLDLDDQVMLKSDAKFVLSLRGDIAGSQHSYEGLLYMNVAIHDGSFDELTTSSLGFNRRVPWMMMGLFDEDHCFTKYANNRKSLEEAPPPVWDEIADCFKPMMDLLEDEQTLKYMYEALRHYREGVIWELNSFKVLETVLFDVAFDLPDETLSAHSLERSMFASFLPEECRLPSEVDSRPLIEPFSLKKNVPCNWTGLDDKGKYWLRNAYHKELKKG